MREPLKFSGIMPANILPFKADLSVDEPAYRRHLRWLADTPGVTGIVANGHAAEVASLSREERRRTLAVALDEVAGGCPVVAGVYTDGTAEAVELTKDAKAAGAAGVLLFPPTLFMWGAQVKPDMVIRHYAEVAAVGLPIVAFEYPPASGIGYAPETLARLAEIARELAASSPEGAFTAASFKDRTGVGRNLTIEILEFLDKMGATQRTGDARVVLHGSDVFV